MDMAPEIPTSLCLFWDTSTVPAPAHLPANKLHCSKALISQQNSMCHWPGCSFGERTQTFHCLHWVQTPPFPSERALQDANKLWIWTVTAFCTHCSKLDLPLYISANFWHLFKNSIMNSPFAPPIFHLTSMIAASLISFGVEKYFLQNYQHNIFVRLLLINFPWTFQHEKVKNLTFLHEKWIIFSPFP